MSSGRRSALGPQFAPRYERIPAAVALLLVGFVTGCSEETPAINRKGAIPVSQAIAAAVSTPAISRAAAPDYMVSRGMAKQEYETVGSDLIGKAFHWELELTKALAEKDGLEEKLKSFQQKLQETNQELRSANQSEPTPLDRASKLTIGEFESDDEFGKRKKQTRLEDENNYRLAHEQWKKRINGLRANIKEMESGSSNEQPSLKDQIIQAQDKIHSKYWVTPPLPRLVMDYSAKEIGLPRFDRESMSFGAVVLPKDQLFEFRAEGSPLKIATIIEHRPATFRIKFKTLEHAKKFKELYEADEYKCRVIRCLDLVSATSPIIVQREVTKEEETYLTDRNAGNILSAIFLNVIGGAMGASPEAMGRANEAMASDPKFQIRPEKRTVVVQPEKKVDGTRYTFGMTAAQIHFVDKNGAKVDGSVEFLSNNIAIKELEKGSPLESQGIEAGDMITRVGLSTVRDSISLRSALRSFQPGELFNVVVIKKKTGEELTAIARGGSRLGVVVDK